MNIQVQTNQGPRWARVIKENAKTIVVQLQDSTGKVIKRHKVKHLGGGFVVSN